MTTAGVGAEDRAPAGSHFVLLWVVLCFVGFVIRSLPVNTRGFWLDESTSLTSALEPRLDQAVISALLHESHPPLYNVVLWAWFRVFPSVGGARFLSIVAGVAAVALAVYLAWILWGRWAALVVSVLGALSPWHIYYSSEIRMYALESALGMLSLCALWKAATRGRRADWALYVASTLAFAWSDFFAVFAVAGQAGWMLLGSRKLGLESRPSKLAYGAILLGIIPLLLIVAGAVARGAGSGARSDPFRLLTLMADLGAGFVARSWIQVAATICVLALAVLIVLRVRSDPRLSFVAAYFFAPIVVVLIAGFFTTVWVERALVFLAPALWVMGGGLGASRAGTARKSPSGNRADGGRRASLLRTATILPVAMLSLVEPAALQAQLTDEYSQYRRLPSSRAYEFVAVRESQGERFLNADIATAAPFIARDRVAHHETYQWEVSRQRNPQIDALLHSTAPTWFKSFVVQLQSRLVWEPAARRVTYAEITRWCNEGPEFWFVGLARPDLTMTAPMSRFDSRLTGGGGATDSFNEVKQMIPSDYHEDRRVEIEGTVIIHFTRSDRAP